MAIALAPQETGGRSSVRARRLSSGTDGDSTGPCWRSWCSGSC